MPASTPTSARGMAAPNRRSPPTAAFRTRERRQKQATRRPRATPPAPTASPRMAPFPTSPRPTSPRWIRRHPRRPGRTPLRPTGQPTLRSATAPRATFRHPTLPADATVEAGPDATPDATGSPEGGTLSDGGVIGNCITVGSRGTVPCAPGPCSSGQVCCAASAGFPPATETCTSSSGCPYNVVGPPYSVSIACRSWGDCPSGNVCCVQASVTAGTAFQTVCTPAASCPNNTSTRVACQNDCECGGLTCKAATCLGAFIATCGGICF